MSLFDITIVALVSTLGISAASCGKDTCSGGNNMSHPRVIGNFDATAPTPVLRVAWDQGTERGAALPDSYFDAPEATCWDTNACPDASNISQPACACVITAVTRNASRELQMTFGSLTDKFGRTLHVGLTFPDRREFIDCSHPGGGDSYDLTIDLDIDATGMLRKSTLKEWVFYGGY